MAEITRRDIPELALVPYRRGYTSVRAGKEDSVGVEVVNPDDSE